jgi:multidrug resistance efflux pump
MSLNQTSLAFQSSGRVNLISLKEDDSVKAGDVIATLDTAAALDAQVAQAQATLDSATANLVSVKAGPTVDDILVAKGNLDHAKGALDQAQAAYDKIGGAANASIEATQQALNLQQASSAYEMALGQFNQAVQHPTDAELKAAQASVASAQAGLLTAKQNAANARITAPFDGTLVWLNAQLGESIVPGTPIATVADLTHMQVQVNADELSAAAIQSGQAVSITVDALPDKPFSGHVSAIGLLATSSGNLVSIPVTVDLDPSDAAIYPGLSATVEFPGGNQ